MGVGGNASISGDIGSGGDLKISGSGYFYDNCTFYSEPYVYMQGKLQLLSAFLQTGYKKITLSKNSTYFDFNLTGGTSEITQCNSYDGFGIEYANGICIYYGGASTPAYNNGSLYGIRVKLPHTIYGVAMATPLGTLTNNIYTYENNTWDYNRKTNLPQVSIYTTGGSNGSFKNIEISLCNYSCYWLAIGYK